MCYVFHALCFMNLSSLNTIKQLCKQYKISPQKHRGQSFLIDKNVLEKIVRLADIKKTDVVLEIGPGFGVLTQKLAQRAKKVIAVELDKKLFQFLQNNLTDYKNIALINEDILKFPNSKFQIPNSGYRLIANLRYSITSAVLTKFLTAKFPPKDIIILVQQEVAERIMAKSGNMNLLALNVQLYGQPEILMKVKPGSFWLKPKVVSALLRIRVGKGYKSKLKQFNDKLFWQIVKAGFMAKRKQLINNFSNNLPAVSKRIAEKWLKQADLSPKIRAEDLRLEDWARLVKTAPF